MISILQVLINYLWYGKCSPEDAIKGASSSDGVFRWPEDSFFFTLISTKSSTVIAIYVEGILIQNTVAKPLSYD